jgi:RNA polymerase sigma-70 factor (ECF subfamily)
MVWPPLAAAWVRDGPAISGNSAVELDRERAFAAFVAAHRDRAIGMAWRLLGGDGAAAEDVAQEAFARAYRALGSFRGEASLSTWFYRILVNEAQRYRRWRWVRERFGGAMPEDPEDPRPSAAGDPALRRRVAQAVATLPRGQREAFVLVHLEGLSLSEAARATGRATGTIKSHLHRALRALREQLADLDPRGETT